MEATWDKVAGWGEDLDFNVGKIDVTENPGIIHVFVYSLIVICVCITWKSYKECLVHLFPVFNFNSALVEISTGQTRGAF